MGKRCHDKAMLQELVKGDLVQRGGFQDMVMVQILKVKWNKGKRDDGNLVMYVDL